MKQVLFIVCITFSSYCSAQDSTRRLVVAPNSIEQPVRPSATLYRTLYFDANWNLLKNKKGAAYYRTPVLKDGERYEVEYFRIDNTRLRLVTYLPVIVNYQLSVDDGVAIRDGRFISYDENGEKETEGSYVQNKKQGEWKNYKEGVQISSTWYVNGVESNK
jgi:hypothetical protein